MSALARSPKQKELKNSRLLKEYASWVYCTGCNQTVAYLCYVTYDRFEMEYTCNCGSCGRVCIEFECEEPEADQMPLSLIKNRFCCPKDNSPLVTIVEKNVAKYQFHIVCHACHKEYSHSG